MSRRRYFVPQDEIARYYTPQGDRKPRDDLNDTIKIDEDE